MKALAYEQAHGFDSPGLSLSDVEEPSLRETDVLVDVRAIGINPGEASIRRSRNASPGGRVILGWEFAGTIAAVGSRVAGFSIGDRVMGTGDVTRDGAWAERVAVDHQVLTVIPDNLDFAAAASIPIGSLTAWEALFRNEDQLPPGVDTVLVVGGAGAVGSLGTQLLKARTSAFVIATASRPESQDWSRRMGADLVVDHTADIPAQLARAGIDQVDMVLSTAGTAQNASWMAKILRPYGHLSSVDGAGPADAGALVSKSTSFHAEIVFTKVLNGGENDQGRILHDIARLVEQQKVQPITTTRLHGLTVESLNAAHEQVETRRTIGKIVITI